MASGIAGLRLPLSLFPGLFEDRKAARAAGHKTYFGGFKCPAGHLSPRRVFDGKCCECIDQVKARERAAYERGVERGKAPELRRKKAEAEAREQQRSHAREARLKATAEAREERRKAKAAATRQQTRVRKEAAEGGGVALAVPAGVPVAFKPDVAPWD